MAVALDPARITVLGSLVAVIALAWAYLAAMAGHGMGAVAAPAAWTPGYAAGMLLMWVLMMVAMMLPSALPMVLLVDRFNRSGATAAHAGRLTALFVCGYVLVWAGFSAAATFLQWGLERSGLLSGAMALSSARLAAVLYIAAGAYQMTPLKRTCLDACRAPLAWLAARWRPGAAAALRMGMAHGAFCLGCCWLLMALLFAGGVMNLLWIVPLALFVLLEKTLPGGERIGRLAGLLLAGWGAAVLIIA